MPYPIAIDFEDRLADRNRLTTFFRLILAIPHLILVGTGPGGGLGNTFDRGADAVSVTFDLLAAGVLNIALFFTSVFSWFAILFTGRMPEGTWAFAALVVGWQFRVNAYLYLLCDEYPPFGDVASPDAYPARIGIERPSGPRNRLTVFFRVFMVIPHAVVLVFVGLAAAVVTIIAWFAILFGGRYPAGMYGFVSGVLAWSTRVSAYLVLLTDEYPPFSLDREAVPGAAAAQPA